MLPRPVFSGSLCSLLDAPLEDPPVAGLEYAAEADAEVVGKPSAAYFESALADLQASPAEAVMVGDDIEADIGGAKRIGMRAVLVRTGKFRPAALENADPQPDTVIDSIADLPALVDKGFTFSGLH